MPMLNNEGRSLPTTFDYTEQQRLYSLGRDRCLDAIRASLRDYPYNGGDTEILNEVDRIVKECSSDNPNIRSLRTAMFNEGWSACLLAQNGKTQETEKEIQELSNETSGTDTFYCLDCGCPCTGEFWVGNTDARRLCSVCKADRTRREQVTEKTPEVQFTFTHATLMTFMQGIMALALEQAKKKNADYASVAGSTNTGLANFYETAWRYGGTAMIALATHRLKHELSIEKMFRGEELESEPIMGRIIDAINYNILALALYIETRQDMELLNKAADKMAALGVPLGTTDYNYSKDNNK